MSATLDRSKPLDSRAYTFMNKTDYLRDIITRIEMVKKGDRVLVATMSFDASEHLVQQLMEALHAAAIRGVATSLAIDARSLPILQKMSTTRRAQAVNRATRGTLAKLEAAGGTYAITN